MSHTMPTGTSEAPWTWDQVQALNLVQHAGSFHGYTCPHHSTHLLYATAEGWICPLAACDYTQTWCSAYMADLSFVRKLCWQTITLYGSYWTREDPLFRQEQDRD